MTMQGQAIKRLDAEVQAIKARLSKIVTLNAEIRMGGGSVGVLPIHTHQGTGGGGQLDHGLALTGLGDDDHTIYLLADGSRDLTGNMAVDPGVTIDGIDISAHAADEDAHHAKTHAATHENGGADEISVAGLSGLLADDQHVLDAEVIAAVEAEDPLDLAGQIIQAGGKTIDSLGALHLNSAAANAMYFDAGALFSWRDIDTGDAVRMTLDSATGHLSTYGYLYPGTGAAMQAVRYIRDDGSTLYLSHPARVVDIDDGADGAYLYLDQDSVSPAAWDLIGHLVYRGKDSNNNWTQYGDILVRIVDPTDTTEDAELRIYLIEGGAANNVLVLTEAGVLSVDASGAGAAAQVDEFDDYDDIGLIEQVRKGKDIQPFLDLGILSEKEDGSGCGYFMNVQTAIWFGFDAMRQLAYRITKLERRLPCQN